MMAEREEEVSLLAAEDVVSSMHLSPSDTEIDAMDALHHLHLSNNNDNDNDNGHDDEEATSETSSVIFLFQVSAEHPTTGLGHNLVDDEWDLNLIDDDDDDGDMQRDEVNIIKDIGDNNDDNESSVDEINSVIILSSDDDDSDGVNDL